MSTDVTFIEEQLQRLKYCLADQRSCLASAKASVAEATKSIAEITLQISELQDARTLLLAAPVASDSPAVAEPGEFREEEKPRW